MEKGVPNVPNGGHGAAGLKKAVPTVPTDQGCGIVESGPVSLAHTNGGVGWYDKVLRPHTRKGRWLVPPPSTKAKRDSLAKGGPIRVSPKFTSQGQRGAGQPDIIFPAPSFLLGQKRNLGI